MYKIETHLHTKESSPCSFLSAEEQVVLHKKAGYDTIFVSDHFHAQMDLWDMPWDKKVDRFLMGYYNAKSIGDKIGLNVLMSAEYMFRESANHYLVYGITEDFLKFYPDIIDVDIHSFHAITQKHNLLLVQAHPFRGYSVPVPNEVDAIELKNGNQREEDQSYIFKAQKIAEDYNLFVTAGTDTHKEDWLGYTGMKSPYPINTSEDFIQLVKSNEGIII